MNARYAGALSRLHGYARAAWRIAGSRLLPWSIVILTLFLTCRPKSAPGQQPASGAGPAVSVAPSTSAAPPPATGFRTEDEANTIAVFRASAPSTVYVTQTRVVEDWFAGTAQEVPAGSGSGFVWDAQGHVVTNFHVVDGAKSVTVTLQDQETFEAQIVGLEPRDRHRQPVRARSHADDRHHQRARTSGAGRRRRVDPRHDPDGRGDQPR
jgi:hypothetical protein